MVGEGLDVGIPLLRDDNGARATGPDLLDVGDDLVVQDRAARGGHDDEDRKALLDERDRAVLELTGGEALRVDVGELLELERPFQRHREADVAAQEQEGGLVRQLGAQLTHAGLLVVQDLLDAVRHGGEVVQVLGDLVGPLVAAQLGQVEPQQVAGGDLGEEGLGGGHGDLRTGVGVEDGVGLAGDGRAVGVDDGQDLAALLAGVTHGLDGVHGLAGLGDGHGQGLLADDRVAVAELVGELDLHGDAAPVLDGVLGDVPGVGGGAAGDDDDLVDAAQNGGVNAHLIELELTALIDAAAQGVGHGGGLLVDLLVHEGVVAALDGCGGVPGDLPGLGLDGVTVLVPDVDGVGRQQEDLVVVDLGGLLGEGDEGGDVTAQEVLALAQADDQGAGAAGGDDRRGGQVGDGQQREGALEAGGDGLHRGDQEVGDPGRVGGGGRVLAQTGGEVDVQDVGDDLGVGVGEELAPGGLDLLAQRAEVLDDAVVDHGEVAGAVGVGVGRRRAAVGGPAGVSDARGGGSRRGGLQDGAQPGELASLLDDIQAGGPHQRDARRVVAAVLQTAEAIHENGQGTGGTSFTRRADVADNSTHAPIESCRRGVDNERRHTSM